MKVAVFSGAAGRAKLLVQNLIKELLHCCLFATKIDQDSEPRRNQRKL